MHPPILRLSAIILIATAGLCWCNESSSVSLSQEEADKKFEKSLEALRSGGRPTPVAHADFAGPPTDNSKRIAEIKDSFKNPNDVIEFGEKPPPPPNGLFKAAEKKGGFIKIKKKGKGKGGKGKGKSKGKKRR